MTFQFPENFEDEVTEYVVDFFKDLPVHAILEPKHMTNARLPNLADEIASMARRHGCPTHFSAPVVKDVWKDGSEGGEGHWATYSLSFTWHGVKGKPVIEVPVLPKDAA